MSDDDFLNDYWQAPSTEFEEKLYQKLKEQDIMIAVLPRQRTFNWQKLAAILLVGFCLSALLMVLYQTDPPTTVTIIGATDDANTEPQQQPADELPLAHQLDTTHIRQTFQQWNYDAPATLAMALSYFDVELSQEEIGAFVQPDKEQDKFTNAWHLADYVTFHVEGMSATVRLAGDSEWIKILLNHDQPVIILRGFTPDADNGWFAHYTLLVGYDEHTQTFTTYDSYLGANQTLSYDELAPAWQQFNNLFMLVYPDDSEVLDLLGDVQDDHAAREKTLEQALFNTHSNVVTAWDWFNLGDALVHNGQFEHAVAAFVRAFETDALPDRILWYFNTPFEAFYHTQQYEGVLDMLGFLERDDIQIEDRYYYRGLVYAAQGQTEEALNQMTEALTINPNYPPALSVQDLLENGEFTVPG